MWNVNFHKFQIGLLFLSPFESNLVCMLLWYPNKWFAICEFQFWPPSDCPGVWMFMYLACCILWSVMVLSVNGMHPTLHSGIQCLVALLFYYSLIMSICRCTWNQPHCLKTPVIEWKESTYRSDLKLETNPHIHCNLPNNTIFHLVPMRLIKHRDPHKQCESWPLLNIFAPDVKLWDKAGWMFPQCSGLSILVFRSAWVRFALYKCNISMSLRSVPYVTLLMSFLNISATLGNVTTRIG